uniref:Exported protein n=1 Tax=Strongyloides venezuelensis TaxID=75913 RepID=A0A0K0FB13_STRVS
MSIQDERLKYLGGTTIFITIAVGILFYNYYSSVKKKEEKELRENNKQNEIKFIEKKINDKNKFREKSTMEDNEFREKKILKHDLPKDDVNGNVNINNILQGTLDFKTSNDTENTCISKTAAEDEDPPTDLDGATSFREEHPPVEKIKKKHQNNEVKEKSKSNIKTPSKGMYGNKAIKEDDPIRNLILKRNGKAE